jgi:SAM-dependent methyltransferase
MKKDWTKSELYSFIRYLECKAAIDNQSLNSRVWGRLSKALGKYNLVRILEVGAGIGTMLERMVVANLFQRATYTGLDISAENISYAKARLPVWANKNGFRVQATSGGFFQLDRNTQTISVEFRSADALEYAQQPNNRDAYDLLIAHAFLDLVDIPSLLPRLFDLLDPEGLFYLTINYDGLTILEPPTDRDLDRQVLELYHETMDIRMTNGMPSGDSQTGRRLFNHIRKAGGRILAAGSSDWVVFAGENGFTEDEVYFLHFIIHTISHALQSHPKLDLQAFQEWIHIRHTQVDSAELVYIAHQMDFLGKI